MVTMGERDTRVKYRNTEEEELPGNEDTEVFEITDFTTASDWERFIAKLEDVIHDWKLPRFVPETRFPKDAFASGKWKETNTDIGEVPDFEFLVKRICLKLSDPPEVADKNVPLAAQEPPKLASLSKTCFSVSEFPAIFEQMLSTDNDFPVSTTLHPLVRWFGLADFMVISPSPFNNIDYKVSEDRLKLIQSSMAVAVSSTKCPVAMFLQFDDLDRAMFAGVSEVTGFRTLYEVIHLEKVADKQRTLSSLVEMFKEKICRSANGTTHLIKTSIQFTLDLNPDEVDFEGLSDELVEDRKPDGLGTLPFGPLEFDSFILRLLTSWPNANADAIEDTLIHTDLDPLQAPKWAVQLILNDSSSYRLADTLQKFAKQIHRQETIQSFLEYLEKDADHAADGSGQATEVLGRLTGERQDRLRSRLSKAFYSRMPKFHFPVPIDTTAINDILAYLFPDSELAKDMQRQFPVFKSRPENAFKTMKAAACDSLPFKLALAVHFVYDKFSGLLGVAYLWQEVLLELRFRWENGYLISGVESGFPNHGTCLLHQKLQMLNCCIAKREADRLASGTGDSARFPTVKSSDSVYFDVTDDEEEEEEFYDCETDDATPGAHEGGTGRPVKPEGRKEAHGTLKLISDGITPLYVPITQEPAPMTEDMAQEQLERLVATDDDAAGRALRLKMQSVALISDMSAFMAANPGCCFEDFVRWHSPRDWEQNEGEEKGHLSERMSQAGSAWMDAWESAECKPVRKQKRLFDERVEAEKVLSFLNMSIGSVFRHTLPMLLQAGLIKLFNEMDATDVAPSCDKQVLAKSLSRLLSDHIFNWADYEKIVKTVRLAEQIISTHRTLDGVIRKSQNLPDTAGFKEFLRSVIETRQLTGIPGGGRSPVGQSLTVIFDQRNRSSPSRETSPSPPGDGGQDRSLKKRSLPTPSVKEFILRTVAPRPYGFSRPGVHRLYASFRPGDVRIAGAFTEDLLYG